MTSPIASILTGTQGAALLLVGAGTARWAWVGRAHQGAHDFSVLSWVAIGIMLVGAVGIATAIGLWRGSVAARWLGLSWLVVLLAYAVITASVAPEFGLPFIAVEGAALYSVIRCK